MPIFTPANLFCNLAGYDNRQVAEGLGVEDAGVEDPDADRPVVKGRYRSIGL